MHDCRSSSVVIFVQSSEKDVKEAENSFSFVVLDTKLLPSVAKTTAQTTIIIERVKYFFIFSL